jgi:hypothetical protein
MLRLFNGAMVHSLWLGVFSAEMKFALRVPHL